MGKIEIRRGGHDVHHDHDPITNHRIQRYDDESGHVELKSAKQDRQQIKDHDGPADLLDEIHKITDIQEPCGYLVHGQTGIFKPLVQSAPNNNAN